MAITGRTEPRSPFRNHERREVPCLPRQSTGITGSDPDPLRRLRIRKFKKWIGKLCHGILFVTGTWRVIHGIWGRPDLDDCARKQERKNSVHRTIEGKNSSVDWSHPDPISNPRTKQHQRILHQLRPSIPFMLKKIVEYNSSTSQDIAVSCVKALKSFKPT